MIKPYAVFKIKENIFPKRQSAKDVLKREQNKNKKKEPFSILQPFPHSHLKIPRKREERDDFPQSIPTKGKIKDIHIAKPWDVSVRIKYANAKGG